jgi:hypothetical protein
MPTDVTRLGLLHSLLSCDLLNHDWSDFYGVRTARSDALTGVDQSRGGNRVYYRVNPGQPQGV